MNRKIGEINAEVIAALGMDENELNKPIFIGDENLKHIKEKHPHDYAVYKDKISEIIDSPDYVGEKDSSIEYVKIFKNDIDSTDEFIKVPVRPTKKGIYFAHSLYKIRKNRVDNFVSKGTLHQVDKKA